MNRCGWILTLALCATTTTAHGFEFGLVGKSAGDANFTAAWRGCDEEARRSGDVCLNLSPRGNSAQPRTQDAAVLDALKRPLAGLAVSVTHSGLLASSSLALAARKNLPVITFDSDLDETDRGLRRGYAGPDNIEFGGQLAKLAQAAHPQGGTVCLLTGSPGDPNLNSRMLGVRRQLSGNPNLTAGARLRGEGGWREPERCPFHSADNGQRAVRQLVLALDPLRANAIISVGQFAVLDPRLFRESVEPLRAAMGRDRQDIIVATGELSEAQRGLLRDGLVLAYVAIDFVQMGRAAYHSLKQLAEGKAIESVVRTPVLVHQR